MMSGYDAFSSFDVDSLRSVITVCELCTKYYQLGYERRLHFIEHLQDEFAPMDDEYSDIVDVIILSLYMHYKKEDLEHDIYRISEKHDPQKVHHVLCAMLDTVNDFLYDNHVGKEELSYEDEEDVHME